MKAIVCKAWGLPDTLVVEELPDVIPGPGQVAIDVKARSEERRVGKECRL